jgi:O-antigen ligase
LILSALLIAFSGAWRIALKDARTAPVLLFACWSLFTAISLAWSVHPRMTLEELRPESLYGALAFFVFFTLARDPNRWNVWWRALVAGALLTLVARELQKLTGVMLWEASPDGGVGAFSTYLVLIAPLLVALVWNSPWAIRGNTTLLAASFIILFVAAWTTRDSWSTPNRIVWPALGAIFLTALVAGRKAADRPADFRVGLRSVIAVGGIAIVVAFIASIGAKSDRFYRDDPSFAASVEHDLRPRLWTVALERWKEAPWFGHGFGRDLLAEDFLPETPVGVEHPPVQHAHNLLLNIALQLGLAGLGLFVAVLVAFARTYVAMLSRPGRAVLGVIGLALIAGFVTKNLTDDFMHRHNAQVFWALNGLLLGFASPSRSD